MFILAHHTLKAKIGLDFVTQAKDSILRVEATHPVCDIMIEPERTHKDVTEVVVLFVVVLAELHEQPQ